MKSESRGSSKFAERIERQADGRPRREALRGGLAAVATVVMFWTAPRIAFAASDKVSKERVQYTDTGNVAGKDCDDCSQFLPGRRAENSGTCKIVEGAISPYGHCIAFSPKG